MAGNNLFGIDIAALVKSNLASGLLDATLHSVSQGARSDTTAGRAQTETDYACKGVVTMYDDRRIDGTLIKVDDREIILIGNTINSGNTIPDRGDGVTIEGVRYTIMRVSNDPARATYTVQGRPE